MTDKGAKTGHQRRVLMLQGPLGPFFADFARALQALGCFTHKIHFNGGDHYFGYADHITPYWDPPEAWDGFLACYLAEHRIDALVLYGDSRFYHQVARDVCARLGVPVFCFEEGYIRPGFVTFEEGGNNASSNLPEKFTAGHAAGGPLPQPYPVKNAFWFHAVFGYRYYYMKDASWRPSFYKKYTGYAHHRPGNGYSERRNWIMAGWRKVKSRIIERGLLKTLKKRHPGPLFFVPLQVAVDSQIIHNSPFQGMPDFLETVIGSFGRCAPPDSHLLIKHHPMDRGFNHYGADIAQLGKLHEADGRITYCFETDITQILDAACGVVTVNSTVGMAALETDVPTIMLGQAMAKKAGLTAGGTLDDFWASLPVVDAEKVSGFRQALLADSQIPGSFYRDRHVAATAAAARLVAAFD